MPAAVKNMSKLRSSKGFSIVELMVAILIGLIILVGVVQVVVTSRTTYLSQEEMSFIQENARYAIDVMGKDILGAGYWGCAGRSPKMALVAKVDAESAFLLSSRAMHGYEATAGDISEFPSLYRNRLRRIDEVGDRQYPDSFVMRRSSGAPIPVTAHTEADKKLTFSEESSFTEGGYITLVAEDCRRVGVVAASEVATDKLSVSYDDTTVCGTQIKPAHSESFDCTSAPASGAFRAYKPGSVAMNYTAHAYYISDSSIAPGTPALKRSVLRSGGGKEEEIALGVEDMLVRYGVREGENLRYLSASNVSNSDWQNVIAIQVNIVVRSSTPAQSSASSQEFLGKTYNDRFMRQMVTSTFRLRNRN